LIFLILVFFLVIVATIDLQTYTIPDIFIYPLIFLGLFSSPMNFFLKEHGGIVISRSEEISAVLSSFQGIIVGGGILYLVGLLGKSMFKREAMGGGDTKLISGVGAFLGAVNVIWVIFLASFLGAITGAALVMVGRYKKFQIIPFGMYICIGAVLVLLLQPIFNRIYFDLIFPF